MLPNFLSKSLTLYDNYYLNKTEKQNARYLDYTHYTDIKSIKEISFRPDYLSKLKSIDLNKKNKKSLSKFSFSQNSFDSTKYSKYFSNKIGSQNEKNSNDSENIKSENYNRNSLIEILSIKTKLLFSLLLGKIETEKSINTLIERFETTNNFILLNISKLSALVYNMHYSDPTNKNNINKIRNKILNKNVKDINNFIQNSLKISNQNLIEEEKEEKEEDKMRITFWLTFSLFSLDTKLFVEFLSLLKQMDLTKNLNEINKNDSRENNSEKDENLKQIQNDVKRTFKSFYSSQLRKEKRISKLEEQNSDKIKNDNLENNFSENINEKEELNNNIKTEKRKRKRSCSQKEIEEHKAKKQILQNILLAYSVRYGGYCQGMNFIAGFLVEFFYKHLSSSFSSTTKNKEQENELKRKIETKSLFIFFCLMKSYKFGKLFEKQLLGLHYSQLCVEKLLKQNTKKLHISMVKEGVTSMTFSTQWFLTLFCYTFEPDDLKVIWDGIFLQGFVFVLKVASAILVIQERLKVVEKGEDVNKCISEFPKHFDLDKKKFIRMVHSFKISYREIESFISRVPELSEKDKEGSKK